MRYNPKILSDARRLLEQEREIYQQERDEQRAKVYEEQPRLLEISRELSGTATRVLQTALRTGKDPTVAIQALKEQNQQLQRERSELLRQMGLPVDYLNGSYLCAKCNDTGYDNNSGKICECLKKRYTKLLQEQLSHTLPIQDQNFNNFRIDYYSVQPDGKWGISPRQNMEYNLGICKAYAENFQTSRQSLLLSGSAGQGKTFLSVCIADAVSKQSFSVSYDTAIHIAAAYDEEQFGKFNKEETAATIKSYEQSDLLIIDDLGMEAKKSFTISMLYNLINNRLMARRPIIINTNLKPTELEDRYNQGVASRLLGNFMILRFFGEDLRRKLKRIN